MQESFMIVYATCTGLEKAFDQARTTPPLQANTGPTLGISRSFGILTLLELPIIASTSFFWK